MTDNMIRARFMAMLLCLSQVGCSFLARTRYFAPHGQNSERASEVKTYKVIDLSGPARALRLTSGEYWLESQIVEDFEEMKFVSFGLFWFPVVPTVVNWFSKPVSSDRLTMEVIVGGGRKEELRWKPEATVIQAGGKDLDRTEAGCDPVSIYESGNPPETIRRTFIRFAIDPKASEFSVRFDGISRGDQFLEFPDVQFKKGKGWAIVVAP
jgi:hypothetical protein